MMDRNTHRNPDTIGDAPLGRFSVERGESRWLTVAGWALACALIFAAFALAGAL